MYVLLMCCVCVKLAQTLALVESMSGDDRDEALRSLQGVYSMAAHTGPGIHTPAHTAANTSTGPLITELQQKNTEGLGPGQRVGTTLGLMTAFGEGKVKQEDKTGGITQVWQLMALVSLSILSLNIRILGKKLYMYKELINLPDFHIDP